MKSLVILAITFWSGLAYAGDSVSVTLESADTIASVHGILVQGQTTTEVTSVKTQQLQSGDMEVAIPIPNDAPQDMLAGAIAKRKTGEIVFSPLRSVRNKDSVAPLALPECAKEAIPLVSKQIPISEQLSLLESVVNVRSEKKNQSENTLKNILSGDLLKRAQALEKHFGFTEGKAELSPTLPGNELVDRLTKLNDAIRRYNAARKATPAAP